MARRIAITNRKGGAGKTTTCLNLAGALVEAGQRVLCIDLDPQASLTRSLHLAPSSPTLSGVLNEETDAGLDQLILSTALTGLDVIPADEGLRAFELGLAGLVGRELRLRRAFNRRFNGSYDQVLVDCPPALGFLTANAAVAVDEVLLPVDLGKACVEALADTLRNITFLKEEINYSLRVLGILVNDVNPRTVFIHAAEASLREAYGEQVLRTTIPSVIVIQEANHVGLPVVAYSPRSSVAVRYRELATEVLERGGNGRGAQAL